MKRLLLILLIFLISCASVRTGNPITSTGDFAPVNSTVEAKRLLKETDVAPVVTPKLPSVRPARIKLTDPI